jgi:hypothetical protein
MRTRTLLPGVSAVLVVASTWPLVPARAADPSSEAVEFFEKKIRPLLVENCFECHGNVKKPKAHLRLDSRAAMLKGGDSGPVLVPGKPEASQIIKAVRFNDSDLRMPKRGKMADQRIADLIAWVKMGAPWPGDSGKTTANGPGEFNLQERRKHWAFQPIKAVIPPDVKNKTWPRSPLDSFILAKLEAAGLSPAPAADKRTLIRRVTYDLTGLPPSPAEIDAFVADQAPDAYEKLVDRLLASPHYGERWGRHWLDLVRFAETGGHEFDFDLPEAYAYRDYVIRAFNADLPYNQFVLEHVAGDLLVKPRRHPTKHFNESILGTGFWFLGESKHSPVDIRQDCADRIDNQIDVFSKTFLGLTVACARCHDHKFDAISTRDYYALSGYLRSSRFQRAFLDAPEKTRSIIGQLQKLEAEARVLAVAASARTLSARTEKLTAFLLSGRTKDQQLDSAGLDRWTKAVQSIDAKRADHPLHAWLVLAGPKLDLAPDKFRAKKKELVEHMRARAARAAEFGDNCIVFEDFSKNGFVDWFVTGDAFETRPSTPADIVWQPDARMPVKSVRAAGAAHSGLISNHLQGALRSRTFTIDRKRIWYHVAGTGARFNLIIDGFQRIMDPIYGGLTFVVNHGDRFAWHGQDVSMWIGHRAYIEVLDDGPGFAAFDKVLFTDEAQAPPEPPNRMVLKLLDDPAVSSPDVLARKYQELFQVIIGQWHQGKLASSGDCADRIALLNWLLQGELLSAITVAPFDKEPDVLAKLTILANTKRQLEAAIPQPKRALAMADGTGENEHIFIRGSHKNLGPEAPRSFLGALSGHEPPGSTRRHVARGSGRLELARRMLDPSDPLPARVMVNRIWQHHFGEGIVRSVDNVGILGERPTHPELLDHLAMEFVEHGWSIKKMHRLMLLSSAYRMASRSDTRADELDPQNKLLHRMPIRRLEAECIRDAMLAVSGRLDRAMFGPGVPPHLTPFMLGRGRPAVSGPLDGAGRRSVYITVRRNFLTPMFLAFDYPIPFTTIGRRSVSNVPAQALTMMNNPFVLQQAETWAKRVLADKGLTPKERIGKMYVTAFGRPPTETESTEALAFLEEQGKQYGRANDPRAWTDLCHVLMNVKEFIFVN